MLKSYTAKMAPTWYILKNMKGMDMREIAEESDAPVEIVQEAIGVLESLEKCYE